MTREERERYNSRKQNNINTQLEQMTQEDRQRFIQNEQSNDQRIASELSQQYHVTVEVIPGDIHHIKINGEVLGYAEFNEWKAEQDQLLRRQRRSQERTREEPVVPVLRGGWFNNN